MHDQHEKFHQITQPRFLFSFCPVCGSPLRTVRLKQNEPDRLVCSKCEFILYLDPKLAVSSIVEMKGGIVLVKRDIAGLRQQSRRHRQEGEKRDEEGSERGLHRSNLEPI